MAPAAQAASSSPTVPDGASFVPGELIVGFHADRLALRQADLQALFTDLQVASAESLQLCAPTGADTQIQVRRVTVPSGEEFAIRTQLAQSDMVAFASPNWIVRASGSLPLQASEPSEFSVNDPLYATHQWYAERINAKEAWSVAFDPENTEPLETIQIAIIDSGINFDHPEFAGRLLQGYNYLNPLARPEDDFGHGTHVAGLAGAMLNNNIGIVGAAPQVVIDPRKVLDQFGRGSLLDVASAICDATDAGAHIINLSLEAPASESALLNAVQYADEKGVLMIASAGNFNQPVQWPAVYPEVMAVAATTVNNERAAYSNKGAELEIAAPGGDSGTPMLSTWRAQQEGEAPSVLCSSYTNLADHPATYCYNQGTSMAAGLVSGAAALIWSMNPSLTADEVRITLRNTSMPLDADPTDVGQGLLDMEKAIRSAAPSALRIGELPPDREVSLGAAPYTVTIPLENPSLEPLAWRATIPAFSWLSAASEISGTIRYGEPATLVLEIRPTALSVGEYGSAITLVGTRLDGSQVTQIVNINFTVINQSNGVRSDLLVDSDTEIPTLAPDAPSYTKTLTITNPSTDPIAWQAFLPPFEWITTTNALSGAVEVAEPAQLQVAVHPAGLPAGDYLGVITFIGTRTDGTQVIRLVDIGFTIEGAGDASSHLLVRSDTLTPTLDLGAPPYSVTLTLENPGTEAIGWQAYPPPFAWISVTTALSGTLDAAALGQLSIQVDPSALSPGLFSATILFTGTRQDGTRAAAMGTIRFIIAEEHRIHLPLIRQNSNNTSPTAPLP